MESSFADGAEGPGAYAMLAIGGGFYISVMCEQTLIAFPLMLSPFLLLCGFAALYLSTSRVSWPNQVFVWAVGIWFKMRKLRCRDAGREKRLAPPRVCPYLLGVSYPVKARRFEAECSTAQVPEMRLNPSRIAPIRLSIQQLTTLEPPSVTLTRHRALPAQLAEIAGGNCMRGLACAVSAPPVAGGLSGPVVSGPRAVCRLAQPTASKTKTTRPYHERLQNQRPGTPPRW